MPELIRDEESREVSLGPDPLSEALRGELRTNAAKRFKKTDNATAMIWRLLLVAEKRFRKIDAPRLAAEVYRGVVFEDGVKITKSHQRVAA